MNLKRYNLLVNVNGFIIFKISTMPAKQAEKNL